MAGSCASAKTKDCGSTGLIGPGHGRAICGQHPELFRSGAPPNELICLFVNIYIYIYIYVWDFFNIGNACGVIAGVGSQLSDLHSSSGLKTTQRKKQKMRVETCHKIWIWARN